MSLRPEAELFYEDLVGTDLGGGAQGTPDHTMSEEHTAAEDFFEELTTGRLRTRAPRSIPGSLEATAPTVFTMPSGTTLGTSGTTAPIATLSPQRQMNEALDENLIAIAKARILAPWIDRKFSTNVGQILADTTLRQGLDLRNDATLRRLLRPWSNNAIPSRRSQLFSTDAFLNARLKAPTTEAELRPVLRLMSFYEVVLLPGARGGTRRVNDVIASVSRVRAPGATAFRPDDSDDRGLRGSLQDQDRERAAGRRGDHAHHDAQQLVAEHPRGATTARGTRGRAAHSSSYPQRQVERGPVPAPLVERVLGRRVPQGGLQRAAVLSARRGAPVLRRSRSRVPQLQRVRPLRVEGHLQRR